LYSPPVVIQTNAMARDHFLFVLAVFGPPTCVLGNVADKTNYSGYLVDNYCYGLNSAGRPALDGTNVILDPFQHSIHCLRDPPQCKDPGYYLAINQGTPGNPNYQIKFRLDEAGNARAVALLTAVEGTRPDKPGDFKVTVVGVHDGDGFLRDASIMECFGPSCDGVCEGNCATPSQAVNLDVVPSSLLVAHVVCMVLSWGLLLPLGVLWARNLRQINVKFDGHPIWFAGHRILQSIGWLLQLMGFAFIYAHKQKGGGVLAVHFTAPHEILGLVVVVLGSSQPINAQLRHLPCVGHPSAEEGRTNARIVWEFLHKGQGYIAVILGAINVIVGVVYAHAFGFSASFVTGAGVCAAILLGFLLVAAIALEVQRIYKYLVDPSKNNNDEAREDPER